MAVELLNRFYQIGVSIIRAILPSPATVKDFLMHWLVKALGDVR
jgi:hypothetical protein